MRTDDSPLGDDGVPDVTTNSDDSDDSDGEADDTYTSEEVAVVGELCYATGESEGYADGYSDALVVGVALGLVAGVLLTNAVALVMGIL